MAGGAVKRGGPGRPKRRPHRLVGDKAYSSRQIRRYLRRHEGYQLPVKTSLTALPEGGWTQLSAGEGPKALRWYDWRWLPLPDPSEQQIFQSSNMTDVPLIVR
jgi:hypothetical protein